MAHHKLILDDELNEDYSLIAIHCSEESYKVAYLLNRFASLKLKRKPVDLEYSSKGMDVTFPVFEFEHTMFYTTYNLVANKCKSSQLHTSSSGLFSEDVSDRSVVTYLIPEYKKVDYFLKIQSDFEVIPLRKLISEINEIKQVISAYSLDLDQIKSKNNLIFD